MKQEVEEFRPIILAQLAYWQTLPKPLFGKADQFPHLFAGNPLTNRKADHVPPKQRHKNVVRPQSRVKR